MIKPSVKYIALAITFSLLAVDVRAQGMLSDMMSGKLVAPEIGAFAWYTLSDTTSNREYFLRQAVVGVEKVKRKKGYWLETELVPKVGFPSVYKMLLTGPARDPKNVHRLLVREGQGAIREVEVDRTQKAEKDDESKRTEAGTEMVSFPGGEIESDHFIIDDTDGKTEIWVSDKVSPMGLVRMTTPQGELLLQRYGVGGKDGASAFPSVQAQEDSAEEVEGTKPEKPKKSRANFRGRRK